MKRALLLLGIGLLPLAACERADMRVCKPLPSEAVGSLERLSEGLAAANAIPDRDASMMATMAARDLVWLACARREAYLLAKAPGDPAVVANAVIDGCAVANERLETARKIQQSLAQQGNYINLVGGERDELFRQASALVVEARAGRCWLQPVHG